MRTRNDRWSRTRLGALGLALALTQMAAAAAAGQTHQSGGSTTVIDQRGGGTSQSQVTAYPDGQRVITRDGQSTDISIQRGSGSAPTATDDADRFRMDDRLAPSWGAERSSPPSRSTDDPMERWSQSDLSREAFRQRMLERLRRPGPY